MQVKLQNLWYGNELYCASRWSTILDSYAPPHCCANWRHQRVVVTTSPAWVE